MRPAERDLPLRHALALGLLQGPTELLPISSSGHTTLLPWLVGWPYAGLDGERRKAFEVALHAGAGIALALHLAGQLDTAALAGQRRRAALLLALSAAPPSLVGFALGEAIERLLGGPRSIALGLAGGAIAMVLADAGDDHGGRPWSEATAADAVVLGLAQATALMPGVSRSGAAIAAARARGFDRNAASVLSWGIALPVILGASALKGLRLLRCGAAGEDTVALSVGAGAAFLATLASARVIGPRRGARSRLLPFAIYRLALAAFVLARLRRGRG